MNRLSVLIGTGLILSFATGAWAQSEAPVPPFKDVPMTHWAYQAVENLRLKGILRGYPDANYRGKRTITRYEMAAALNRIPLDRGGPIVGKAGEPGPRGPQGERGPKGEPGPRGVPPIALSDFRTTLEELQKELGAIHQQVDATDQRADSLAGQVRDLKKHAGPVETGK